MSLEEYRQKVWEFLTQTVGTTSQHAEELMKAHEDDLPEFSEKNWPPNEAGCAMIIGC